jgi:fused signal recognition particle receptor
MAWFGRSKDRPEAEEKPAKKSGLFSMFRLGLQKTSELLRTDIRDLVTRKEGQLVDDWLDELFGILVKTDMGAGPAAEIRDYIASEFRGRRVHLDELLHAVKTKFLELLGHDDTSEPIEFAESGPTVVMVVGVNGAGKTTSIAKLAHRFTSQGKSVVLGAGDTFRAGAVRQLGIWAERLGVEFVEGQQGGDPASVAHRAATKTIECHADVCIVDTAGRLQTQRNLMQELEKIHRVISKVIPGGPHEVLLVLDATAGQNGISQASGFSEAAACTGIVLAKLDGTAKGGVIIPIRKQFGIPVKFVGVGEQPSDLAVFNVNDFVDGLFGPTEPSTEYIVGEKEEEGGDDRSEPHVESV